MDEQMLKQHPQFFDAQAWARVSLREAPQLQPATLEVVSGFTFLWNFFEGVTCNGSVSVQKLGQVAERMASSPALANDSVEHCLSFYRFRYLNGDQLQERFYGLNFRTNDRHELVEAVLRGTESGLNTKLHALLIIAYRIRNNMFHGLKSVHIWDDQAQNISEATRILSIALEALNTYIVERPHAT
ncbi:MAG: hypothetical protein V5B44_10130 [Candidatus Accumulibacter necessarius]|jgi:hypothetical protein|uniref:hypothetical protein n=1 Tax=Candidatus Accumulibacter necessarius TaxID=2954386 RepID=UPI002FC38D68